MDNKIKIGILGYGNLGRGVEYSLMQNEDMELVGVFTRRDPSTITPITKGVEAYNIDSLLDFVGKIDVLVLCGGSATDLPEQTPEYTKYFNTVDSFDTHAKIPEFYAQVNKVALENDKVSIISVGWDPGMFSVNRLYSMSILPKGTTYTFWGKGVSQGHSDAIRRVKGVKNGKQYTIPLEEALNKVRTGENPELSTREKHLRECFVVLEDGADKDFVEQTIKNMPNYFADYDTVVHFIDEETLLKEHSGIPHGGFVIHSGKTGENDCNTHVIEYSLKLDSNPEFTSSVLICYARAAYRLACEKDFGAKTVFDIAPKYLSSIPYEKLIAELL